LSQIPALLRAAPELAWQHLQWNHFFSARYRLHYFATPKVACTALKWWFAELEGVKAELLRLPSLETLPSLVVHDTLPFVAAQQPGRNAQGFAEWAQNPDLFRFALVRHPVARVFSAWVSKVVLAEPHQAQRLDARYTHCALASEADVITAFERFVTEVVAVEAEHGAWSDPHWAPQTVLLQPGVIRYTGGIHPIEQLPTFAQRLGEWAHQQGLPPLPLTLDRYNESVLTYRPQWISEVAKARIAQCYAEDFAAFGYDARVLPPGRAAEQDGGLDVAWLLIQAIRERNARFAALRAQVLQQSADLEALPAMREELRWLREQQTQHRALIAHLEQALRDAERHRDALVGDYESRLAAILQSTSWRVTAPLRKLKRLASSR